jgi:predicted enzyme related to lactoylglutathione lyase
VTPLFLIELPADDPERARRFWQELLQTTLDSRRSEEGHGWQADYDGIVFGLHERGPGPGDRFSLPYFAVADHAPAVVRVRAVGGEVVNPGGRWVICRDSEGTPFGLAGSPQGLVGAHPGPRTDGR